MSTWVEIGCADVRFAGYESSGCCSSCHDDDEEGYTNGMCVMRADYPDFIEPNVCCDVANAVGKDFSWLQLVLAHIARKQASR